MTHDILNIGYYLHSVDGSAEKREATASGVMARELLFKRWNNLVSTRIYDHVCPAALQRSGRAYFNPSGFCL